jgi:hypothetical protein
MLNKVPTDFGALPAHRKRDNVVSSRDSPESSFSQNLRPIIGFCEHAANFDLSVDRRVTAGAASGPVGHRYLDVCGPPVQRGPLE